MTLAIVIPTYNRAPALERLLQQLLAQHRVPEQIIIVDDHSTDDTAALVRRLAARDHRVQYVRNWGRYQRDGKKTGLMFVRTAYVGFLDDDALIEDPDFFAHLASYLCPNTVIQAKVILENMGRRNINEQSWIDRLTTRPYPLLELLPPQYNTGTEPRLIYPLIEFGNFWPVVLREAFIDEELIADGYGESYSWSLKLWRRGVRLRLVPDLVIRHPGSHKGGSQRFGKTTVREDFRPFHEGYFYNMVSIHARYYPGWVWLWLPFYVGKAVVALLLNRNFTGCMKYGINPIFRSWWQYGVRRAYGA